MYTFTINSIQEFSSVASISLFSELSISVSVSLKIKDMTWLNPPFVKKELHKHIIIHTNIHTEYSVYTQNNK